MASKKVKKEKTSKRGKGDVKQSVKVSVRIGEAKPKRKRQYKRRPKGEGSDLARVGETRTLYGNLPPPPPQQIIYTQPQLPPAFQAPQPQPQISGLLEDVKRERQNLLEDIKRETSSQIQKAQGAEQRAELAKAGAFDPFNTEQYARPTPSIEDSIKLTAPSFKEVKDAPMITEISSTLFKQPEKKKGEKKIMFTETDTEGDFTYTRSLPKQTLLPENIQQMEGQYKVEEPASIIKELPKQPLVESVTELSMPEEITITKSTITEEQPPKVKRAKAPNRPKEVIQAEKEARDLRRQQRLEKQKLKTQGIV